MDSSIEATRRAAVAAVVALRVCVGLVTGAPALEAQGAGSVRLVAGDAIEVRVVADTARSGVFVVDDRGDVVLPFIGTQRVTVASWGEVRDSLAARFARELRWQTVQLTPLRRVPILGHVNKAGLYWIDPHVSIAGAIAMAQGAASDGDLRRIRLVRDGGQWVGRVPLESTLAAVALRSGDQLYVERRTWWDRNSGTVVGALISAVALLVTVGR